MFWTDIEVFIISTVTALLILMESFKRKKKPKFNALADNSIDESNIDESQEKELRFKALENIINKIKGESAMEK